MERGERSRRVSMIDLHQINPAELLEAVNAVLDMNYQWMDDITPEELERAKILLQIVEILQGVPHVSPENREESLLRIKFDEDPIKIRIDMHRYP
jgi:hypothetical protein